MPPIRRGTARRLGLRHRPDGILMVHKTISGEEMVEITQHWEAIMAGAQRRAPVIVQVPPSAEFVIPDRPAVSGRRMRRPHRRQPRLDP